MRSRLTFIALWILTVGCGGTGEETDAKSNPAIPKRPVGDGVGAADPSAAAPGPKTVPKAARPPVSVTEPDQHTAELEALRRQAEYLSKANQEICERIKELEAAEKE